MNRRVKQKGSWSEAANFKNKQKLIHRKLFFMNNHFNQIPFGESIFDRPVRGHNRDYVLLCL